MFKSQLKNFVSIILFIISATTFSIGLVAYRDYKNISNTQSGAVNYSKYIIKKNNSSIINSNTIDQINLSNEIISSAKELNSISASNDSNSINNDSNITVVIDMNEVSRHNSLSNCWIVIDDLVYDSTNYIPEHPGGSQLIIDYCGRDASSAFHNKGGRRSDHSGSAKNILARYVIAKLGSVVEVVAVISPVISSIQSSSVNIISSSPVPGVMITNSVVSIHNTPSDCWIIASGNVYNITNFINQHPGGITSLAPFCGVDATSGLSGSAGSPRHKHSAYAYSLLNNYIIGSIGSLIQPSSSSQIISSSTNPNNSGVPPSVLNTYPDATLIKKEDGGKELKINTGGSCLQVKIDNLGNIIKSEPC
jgi:cytochrome b involved in lipid metabolism